ncbi:MAG TPA: hypothetical protein VGR48_00460 [Terriglobales bacterium]|nr:hypothetical protein [Terriglobales bacterium]
MPGENPIRMQCAEFEALLAEALDGQLSGGQLEDFRQHRNLCPVCGPLFAQAETGLNWLKAVPQVQPPPNLVNRILAATTGVQTRVPAAVPVNTSWPERLRGWVKPVLAPVWSTARQPRFAMSFAMVFFSVSIALNAAGVRIGALRHADLRPSALVRGYYETSAKVVKYYENIRFVYELESRVRDLKRVTEPEEPARPVKEKNRNNNTSGTPEQNREQNYSREEGQPLLASAPAGDPQVWPVHALRRLV